MPENDRKNRNRKFEILPCGPPGARINELRGADRAIIRKLVYRVEQEKLRADFIERILRHCCKNTEEKPKKIERKAEEIATNKEKAPCTNQIVPERALYDPEEDPFVIRVRLGETLSKLNEYKAKTSVYNSSPPKIISAMEEEETVDEELPMARSLLRKAVLGNTKSAGFSSPNAERFEAKRVTRRNTMRQICSTREGKENVDRNQYGTTQSKRI